jgi:hypothetical protein
MIRRPGDTEKSPRSYDKVMGQQVTGRGSSLCLRVQPPLLTTQWGDQWPEVDSQWSSRSIMWPLQLTGKTSKVSPFPARGLWIVYSLLDSQLSARLGATLRILTSLLTLVSLVLASFPVAGATRPLGLTLRLACERIRVRRFPLGGAMPDSVTNWRSCICAALVSPRPRLLGPACRGPRYY